PRRGGGAGSDVALRAEGLLQLPDRAAGRQPRRGRSRPAGLLGGSRAGRPAHDRLEGDGARWPYLALGSGPLHSVGRAPLLAFEGRGKSGKSMKVENIRRNASSVLP